MSEVSEEIRQLRRCLPCDHCGALPILTGKAFKCANPRDSSYKGACKEAWVINNKYAEARKRWNRIQKKSFVDYSEPLKSYTKALRATREIMPCEDASSDAFNTAFKQFYTKYIKLALQARIGALSANNHRLGKLLEQKKAQIHKLQAEVQRLRARS